jgi:CheY-like chemotaxis protein
MNSEPSNANADRPATSVLFIDASKTERNYWADQLKRCSADYEILEASDGKEGIALCQSRRIDCVVLELSLSGESGLKTLMQLVPIARKPQMAVVVLTVQTQPGMGAGQAKWGVYMLGEEVHGRRAFRYIYSACYRLRGTDAEGRPASATLNIHLRLRIPF